MRRLDESRADRQRRWARRLATVVVGGLVVYVAAALVRGFAEGTTALEAANPMWLAAALGAEACAYVLLAVQLRRLCRRDITLSHGHAVRLGLVLCGFGCVTPASPAEGMVITGGELRRRGLSTRRAAIILGVVELTSAVAMAGLAAVNVFVAASLSDVPSGVVMPLIAAALVTVLALGVIDLFARRQRTAEWVAVVLGALCFWRPCPPVETRRAAGAAWHAEANTVVGSTPDRLMLVAISAGAWLADVVCLRFALAALGVALPLDVVLLAYTVGVLATLVPFLPAGLGLVETAVPLVLHGVGVPIGAAVAAVLVYRCVSTLLPAAVGVLCIPGIRAHRGVAPAAVPVSVSALRQPT